MNVIKYPIIGLYGKMGSGKDTAGEMFSKHLSSLANHANQCTILIDGFANPLKEILIKYFGFTHDDLYTQEGKMRMNDLFGFTNREAAQRFGTDAMRNNFHPDVWFIAMDLRRQKSHCDINIITDVRFPNECQYIKSRRGIVINIVRPNGNTVKNVGIQNHASEADLPAECYDVTIVNDGTLQDLEDKVVNLINKWKV